jgi:hypothetical protein
MQIIKLMKVKKILQMKISQIHKGIYFLFYKKNMASTVKNGNIKIIINKLNSGNNGKNSPFSKIAKKLVIFYIKVNANKTVIWYALKDLNL